MECSVFIAVFKQINNKTRFFKGSTQGFIIINNFMSVRRMIGITITANFDNTLIPLVSEIGIGNSHSYVSSICEKIITILCSDTAIVKCHVLPNVFSKKGKWLYFRKHSFKVSSIKQIKLIFLCAYPTLVCSFTGTNYNFHV